MTILQCQATILEGRGRPEQSQVYATAHPNAGSASGFDRTREVWVCVCPVSRIPSAMRIVMWIKGSVSVSAMEPSWFLLQFPHGDQSCSQLECKNHLYQPTCPALCLRRRCLRRRCASHADRFMLVAARKHATAREILLWMIPSEPPKALQASECSELLDPMRVDSETSTQH